MRARLGHWICSAMILGVGPSGCTRENPSFDDPTETQVADDTTSPESGDELPDMAEGSELGEDCTVASGTNMTIKVPQPCGETDDVVYEHWFLVTGAAGSSWSVQFCGMGCTECEPIPGQLVMSPLPLDQLAGPDTCLLLTARRLEAADDCNYQAVTVRDMTANGQIILVARHASQIEIPALDSASGLLGFAPNLVKADTCDCEFVSSPCCEDQAPTRYDFEVNGVEIPLGESDSVNIGGRSYGFWAHNAYASGECDVPVEVSWSLTAN